MNSTNLQYTVFWPLRKPCLYGNCVNGACICPDPSMNGFSNWLYFIIYYII